MVELIKRLFGRGDAKIKDELGDTELKILSKFVSNQKIIIDNLSQDNQQLRAELEVLREIVDELSSINNIVIDKALASKDAKRKQSPFKKLKK
tara:strand:- start:1769 stop:2047 length:279 start_codon:yes stop_codon:yes gene_type:complete